MIANASSPRFNELVSSICGQSPLQRKKIEKFLSGKDETFFKSAEAVSSRYLGFLEKEKIPLQSAVRAYLGLCNEMLCNQIKFMKTGQYPAKSAEHAFETVYNDASTMKSYMIGLAISQVLWPSHERIYRFFEDNMRRAKDRTRTYLEIGPGHALFLNVAAELLPASAHISVVDISATAVDIARAMMRHFQPDRTNIEYHQADFLTTDGSRRFDFITMGEVIEHVTFPDRLLRKLRDALSEDGRAFVSTCVDCPAKDHVYHFKSVEEIRTMLRGCGLEIQSECVAPVEDLPMEEIVMKKITINYAAMVGASAGPA